MKIKKSILVSFLSKISLQSDSSIVEAVFDFQDDGVHVKAMTPDNIVMVNGFLRASVFENYAVLGEVGFQEIPSIINIVKTFSEDVEISINGNISDFKEKDRGVALEILDVSIMQKGKEIKGLELDETVLIESKKLNTLISDMTSNNKGEFNVKFTTGNNVMGVSNTVGKYKFRDTFRELDCKEGTNATFGVPLANAIKNLTDEIAVSLKTNFPIKIVETTADSTITIVVAPRVENTNVIEVPAPKIETPKVNTQQVADDSIKAEVGVEVEVPKETPVATAKVDDDLDEIVPIVE